MAVRRKIAALLAAAAAAAAAPDGATAQTVGPEGARAVATYRQADLARGVNTRGFVEIGGIRQWISVQGRTPDAPLLLFLHGGPGLSTGPSSWYFLAPWEDYFTVVQWDQRGAGKTFAANPPGAGTAPLSVEQSIADSEAVVLHLRATYGPHKIVLVGYSWGSIIGLTLAQRHPDWFSAYVGIGQFIDFAESERRGYAATLADARRAGDTQAVAALEALAPYPKADPAKALPEFFAQRRWLNKYGGMVWNGDPGRFSGLDAFSPDYDAKDLAAVGQGMAYSFSPLWPQIAQVNFSKATRFQVPVVFIDGAHDRNTSATLLSDWLKTVRAPSKRLVLFPNAAHFPYQEEPGRMLSTLVDDVLPLTRTTKAAADLRQ